MKIKPLIKKFIEQQEIINTKNEVLNTLRKEKWCDPIEKEVLKDIEKAVEKRNKVANLIKEMQEIKIGN